MTMYASAYLPTPCGMKGVAQMALPNGTGWSVHPSVHVPGLLLGDQVSSLSGFLRSSWPPDPLPSSVFHNKTLLLQPSSSCPHCAEPAMNLKASALLKANSWLDGKRTRRKTKVQTTQSGLKQGQLDTPRCQGEKKLKKNTSEIH